MSAALNGDGVDSIFTAVCEEFKLNDPQRAVLTSCLPWLKGDGSSPVRLVWGVFGSGKSMCLVALIVMFIRCFAGVKDKKRGRILVTSTTNVAVDRILSNLIDVGYAESVVRVG